MAARSLRTKFLRAVPVFAALGDQTRAEIVARLSQGEPVSITRLSEDHEISRQAVTKHLHVLAQAGLVHGTRNGREQLWALDPGGVGEARQCLEAIGEQWERALGRLKSFVEEDED